MRTRCLALLSVVVVGTIARAETPSEVVLEVAGEAPLAQTLEETVRALLGDAGLRTRAERVRRLDIGALLAPPPRPAPRARVFVDLSSSDEAILVIGDDAGGRWSIRRLPRRAGEDDILVEQIAQIVQAALGAILAGDTFGQPRADALSRLRALAPPATPVSSTGSPVAPPRPEGGTVDASALLGYGATLLGAGAPAHGPSLGVRLGFAPRASALWTSATVGYRFGPDVSAASDLEGRLDALRLRAMLGMSTAGQTRIGAQVGVGADITFPRLEVQAPLRDAADPSATFIASVGAHLEVQLATDVALLFDLGLELTPWRRRWVILDAEGEARSLLTPFWVRPAISIGLRVF